MHEIMVNDHNTCQTEYIIIYFQFKSDFTETIAMEDQRNVRLNLGNLVMAFYVLGVGLAFATVSFSMEYCCARQTLATQIFVRPVTGVRPKKRTF
jgi:hypothetical protein